MRQAASVNVDHINCMVGLHALTAETPHDSIPRRSYQLLRQCGDSQTAERVAKQLVAEIAARAEKEKARWAAEHGNKNPDDVHWGSHETVSEHIELLAVDAVLGSPTHIETLLQRKH